MSSICAAFLRFPRVSLSAASIAARSISVIFIPGESVMLAGGPGWFGGSIGAAMTGAAIGG